jgi:hypothetical protein
MEGIEKRCIIRILKERYRRGSKGEPSQILIEVSKICGVGRRQARRYFEARSPGRPKETGCRGWPSRYQDTACVKALRGCGTKQNTCILGT